jgi:hypothetical protein
VSDLLYHNKQSYHYDPNSRKGSLQEKREEKCITWHRDQSKPVTLRSPWDNLIIRPTWSRMTKHHRLLFIRFWPDFFRKK